MEYKKLSLGGYNLHLIKTDRFKISHIEVIFHNDLNIEDITKRQMLTNILIESNKTYPTKRKLALKLEDLYDASLFSDHSKVGNNFVSSFGIDFLNPEFSEKGIVKDSIKLLFDIILNPNVNISEFDNKSFTLVKDKVKDSINRVKEDPKRLSLLNALKHLGDTPTSYSNLGSLEALEEITPTNLYTYYEKMIKEDYVDIFVVGNLDMDEVTELVIEYAKFNIIKTHPTNLHVYNRSLKEKFFSDKSENYQTNLVVVLNLSNITPYEEKYVANLYNGILGQSSLKNKLFQNLRERESLCYGVRSIYQKYDGQIVITTGIDSTRLKEAIKIIKRCLKEMTNDISDEELSSAKEQILTNLNCSEDTIERIVSNYFYMDLNELEDVETRIKTYKQVTKEDIYEFSKKVDISLIYALEGGSNE